MRADCTGASTNSIHLFRGHTSRAVTKVDINVKSGGLLKIFHWITDESIRFTVQSFYSILWYNRCQQRQFSCEWSLVVNSDILVIPSVCVENQRVLYIEPEYSVWHPFPPNTESEFELCSVQSLLWVKPLIDFHLVHPIVN